MNPAPRILVVEDEQIVAMDIERGLRRMGYGIAGVAASGAEAIQLAEKTRPDLVLMDVQLKGGIDGVEAARGILARHNIPVVFLTAYADEVTLRRAKSVGPFGYLLKPFEETELHTAIEVVLQKHRLLQAQRLEERRALEESEERFRWVVDSIRDYAIYMLDIEGRVASWNPGAERALGYRGEEVLGREFSMFYPSDRINEGGANEGGEPRKELEVAVREGRYEEEGWRVRKDGSMFWASDVLTAVRDSSGKVRGFSKVTRDITERKKMVDELKDAVRSREEFLSIASHELKTPLTSLSLQLQMLRHRFQEFWHQDLPGCAASAAGKMGPEKLGRSLEICERQTKKLGRLLEELLDLTRIRAGRMELKRERVDLAALTRDVVAEMEGGSNHLPEIRVLTDTDVWGFWDRGRIERVVTNLVSNAVKYGDGKPVEITVRKGPRPDQVWLSVRDQGIGIPPNMRERIFKCFERAVQDRSIGGLGLGLYIARQIVEAHGGSIEVESAVGKGSTFVVQLPTGER